MFTMHSAAITPAAKQGVLLSAWTSRSSRMQVWDAASLEPGPYQDLKARAQLLDLSPDGRYVAYYAEAQSRGQSYIAISRPPWFHALFLRSAFTCGVRQICFGERATLWGRILPPDRRLDSRCLAPNPPFELVERSVYDPEWDQHREERTARCSTPWFTYPPPSGEPDHEVCWSGNDCCGRAITLGADGVEADGVLFLPYVRAPFEPVAPPAWALEW